MKRFVICIFCIACTSVALAQPMLNQVIRLYYKVDPFSESFSKFIYTLSNDEALSTKQEHKKTNSAGYYLRGKYKGFNPFGIPSNSIDMIFYEDWLDEPQMSDDAYYSYQITAYFPNTDLTKKKVIKEYKKMVHKLQRAYPNTHLKPLNGQEGVDSGEIRSFRNEGFPVTTAIASWQTLPKTQQLGLTILLRLKRSKGRLVPLAPAARPGATVFSKKKDNDPAVGN